MKKEIATFISEFDQINQKITRSLIINNLEVAKEIIHPKIKTKLSQIEFLMMELEHGREFKSIQSTDWQVILDVFESSTPEYFKRWIQDKMSIK